MRTGANRGEAPGTDSVPSASGSPADPSGEELTALGSMARFSFQKQFPLPILPPPCPWPDVAHDWFSRSREAGSTGARGAGPTVEPRAKWQHVQPGPCRNQRGVRKDRTGQGLRPAGANESHLCGDQKGQSQSAPPPPRASVLLNSPRKPTGILGKAGVPEPNRCLPTHRPACLLSF